MRRIALVGIVLLAACKPPPTDAGLDRELPEPEPSFASEPLPSPDTEGALWAPSPRDPDRIIYGIPGSPALLSLTCLAGDGLPRLRITRMSPADEGAGALLALVGNGHIGRIEVDAVEVSGTLIWRGEVIAADTALDPLTGPREVTATVPGAGLVTLNPSPLPMQLLESCRTR
ncbi:MAG: hypothetical protein V2J14_04665 [Erythrobacter sp.]|jgi:hypothetical protein|nr:hypothetical protein [Erythrobacter sp.]